MEGGPGMDQTQRKGRPDLVGSKAATEINEPRDSNATARNNQPAQRCGFDHEDGEDMIDFQVADYWLGFYHQQGLTPRCSDQFQQGLACSEVCGEHELLERAAS